MIKVSRPKFLNFISFYFILSPVYLIEFTDKINDDRPKGRLHNRIDTSNRHGVLEKNMSKMTKQLPDFCPRNTSARTVHTVCADELDTDKRVTYALKAEVI